MGRPVPSWSVFGLGYGQHQAFVHLLEVLRRQGHDLAASQRAGEAHQQQCSIPRAREPGRGDLEHPTEDRHGDRGSLVDAGAVHPSDAGRHGLHAS